MVSLWSPVTLYTQNHLSNPASVRMGTGIPTGFARGVPVGYGYENSDPRKTVPGRVTRGITIVRCQKYMRVMCTQDLSDQTDVTI